MVLGKVTDCPQKLASRRPSLPLSRFNSGLSGTRLQIVLFQQNSGASIFTD